MDRNALRRAGLAPAPATHVRGAVLVVLAAVLAELKASGVWYEQARAGPGLPATGGGLAIAGIALLAATVLPRPSRPGPR